MRLSRTALLLVMLATPALGACHHNQPQQYPQQMQYPPQQQMQQAAYTNQNTQVCVDPHSGVRVYEDQCSQSGANDGSSPFLWYYMASQMMMPGYGQQYAGGTFSQGRGTYYRPVVPVGQRRSAYLNHAIYQRPMVRPAGYGAYRPSPVAQSYMPRPSYQPYRSSVSYGSGFRSSHH